MPSPQQILDGLEKIANQWRPIAVAWHVALGILLLAVLFGWRPRKRLAGVLLSAPLVSVSALAWAGGNPFNGTVFAVVAMMLVGVACSLPPAAVRIARPWPALAGSLLLLFGWTYPHFLRVDSWTAYLYAAPLGLVPCPTLCAVTGFTLLVEGLGSRTWSLILAATGLLYGLIGAFRLEVAIDLALLAGAGALAFEASARWTRGEVATSHTGVRP